MTKLGNTYADAGVDVDVEAKAAKILYEAAKKTWTNRKGLLGDVVVPYDDFAGLRFVRVDKLPEGTVMYGGSDGVATKADFAERANRFDTLAYDLIAMVCDDAVIKGGEPVLLKNVLDMNTLGQDESRLRFIRELAVGLVAAAKEAGIVVINGELAQLNDRKGRMDIFSVDWSADVTWFAHESRLITGYDVKPGDALVGLREEGLRCNGISLVRKVLREKYGDNWENEIFEGERLVDVALKPSRIYSGAVVDMFGGCDLTRKPKAIFSGAAHISGGGLPEKLGRLLRATGYGAKIDQPFTPSSLMLHCQDIGGVTDYEAYRAWNMGQGMVIVTADPDSVITVSKEHGIEAKVIGSIQALEGISIKSKGFYAKEEGWLKYK